MCCSTTTKSCVFHVTAFRWPCLFVNIDISCYSVLFYKRLYIQYKRLRVEKWDLLFILLFYIYIYMFRKIAVRLFYSTVYGQICFKSSFPFPICEKCSLDVLACSLLELIQAKVLFLLTFRKQTVLAAYLYLLFCVTLVSNYLCIYSNLIN